MSEQPPEQQTPANPNTQADIGWDRVAQEMHTWHPGLQEHAKRHLQERGLLHLVSPTDSESIVQPVAKEPEQSLKQTQSALGDTLQVSRLVRPTMENVPNSSTTEYVTAPFGISLRDIIPDSMKEMEAKDVVFAHGVDEESLRHVDELASKLYARCVDIMNSGSTLQKYALATIISRGVETEGLNTENEYNTFLLMRLPSKLIENGLRPTDYEDNVRAQNALAESRGISENDDNAMDTFDEEIDALEENTFDPDESIRDQIEDEIIKSVDDVNKSEIGRFFMDRWDKSDVLDMLTVLKVNAGNVYSNRLLLRFFEAWGKYTEQHNNIDVVACYQGAASAVEQKIDEGVIPVEFRKKIQLYHPIGFEFVDKMVVAINNNANNWAGYYHGGNGNGGTFSIVEDYSDLLPDAFEEPDVHGSVFFREPGTEDLYEEQSDYRHKIAIHELFHHLSGHAYTKLIDETHNRKVGLSTGSWGRMLNEAITERLASLVYPQADQSYSEERAFLHALQSNSEGLITDDLLYDAYLEEREEGGLPQLKKLIQIIGEAYGQKGFIQRVDKVFEDDGYQAAIDYLRHATKAMGRQFVEPLGNDEIAA